MPSLPGPIPDPSSLCVSITTGPGEVCIEFPGGARICATYGFDSGSLADVISSLLAQVNSSLAPLQPILDIFDVLKAIFDCIQAIPETLGPPPSPVPIVNCIQGLAKAIDKILELIPPFPILKMVKGIIHAIGLGLQGLRQRLAAMIAQANRVLAAGTRAAKLGGGIGIKLQQLADCGSSNLEAQLQNMNQSMAPLNRLIGLVNVLLELVGQPCIPVLGIPAAVEDAALAPLDAAIKLLQIIEAAIPAAPQLPILPPPGQC